jgi:MFS family permease
MTLLRSLTHRPFALLWSGQTVSRLGDSLYRIALAWWVLEKTGSAAAMGAVMVFAFTPMLVFLLIGGVAVDRLPRLRVMLVCDLVSGLVVASVSILAFSDRLEVWHIYLASALFGLVEAFFFPAYTAAVPQITPSEVLPSANALTSLSSQVSGIAGPALAASIVALGGTAVAFALDAVSFFVSAACLIPIVGLAQPHASPEPSTHILGDLREGISLVFASPWLWITIALFSLVNVTASGPRAVALPFLVQENMHAEVKVLGLLGSCTAAGSLLGALWLGRRARLRRRGIWGYGATIAAGLALGATGLRIPLAGVAGASLIFGLALEVFGLIWTNTLQELIPPDKLGRVSSIDALGSFVLLPVGYAVAGWATDLLGAPTVFLIGGAATVVLAGLGLLHPAVRNLD